MLATVSSKRFHTPASQPRKRRYLAKDPELVELLKMIERSGLSDAQIAENAEKKGYTITAGCVYQWRNDNVYRPNNYSISAVLAGLGYRRIITAEN